MNQVRNSKKSKIDPIGKISNGAKAVIYNSEGKEVDKIDLSNKFFCGKINLDLLHQAICYYESLQRRKIAKVKDRSEKKGGGRKPWRQKGTGRARHGSIRSPIWKGGGVTFGPSIEKNFEKKFPLKMRKKALSMALSQKLKDEEIIFVDEIKAENQKTKEIESLIKNLTKVKKDLEKSNSAIVLKERDSKVERAALNLKKLSFIPYDSLNSYFVFKNKYIIMDRKALDNLKN